MKSRFVQLLLAIAALATFPLAAQDDLGKWGKFISPLGDCPFKQTEARMEITVPGTERPHGLTAELQSMDAPRVLQPIKGDFTIQVKAGGLLDPGNEATEPGRAPYNAGGLVVMIDEKNYVTLVRAALQRDGRAFPYANFEMRVNGECEQIGDARARPLKLDQPAFLKLARRENVFRGFVSDDGEHWDEVGTKEAPRDWPAEAQAGIVAISNARQPFSADFAELKLQPAKAPATVAANAPVNPFNQYEPSDSSEDCELCKKNLAKISEAILAYRKEHKDIPNWLSDLVPKYLPDDAVLICPVTTKTGRLSPFGALDPKLRSSYLYEFCPTPMTATVKGAFDGPLRTNRDWKRQQMGLVGSEVPIVRCLLHNPVLNLSFGGRIYESPMFWEQNFLDVVRMEDFAPR
jgi:regulation of enolase protein 1 (concanavalin A-like superfamily)